MARGGASRVLVVPGALAAAWLWRKAHRLAAQLALGVRLATLDYAVAEILGADYVNSSPNSAASTTS